MSIPSCQPLLLEENYTEIKGKVFSENLVTKVLKGKKFWNRIFKSAVWQ